jgi:hypothetical protein
MERTGDTEQAGESLEAVLDSFVPSNSSNKNLPKIDFKKNLLQVLQQKYPTAEFKITPDRVESTDGQLFVIADTEQEGSFQFQTAVLEVLNFNKFVSKTIIIDNQTFTLICSPI